MNAPKSAKLEMFLRGSNLDARRLMKEKTMLYLLLEEPVTGGGEDDKEDDGWELHFR